MLAAVLIVAGCGSGDDEPAAEPAEEQLEEETSEATAEPEPVEDDQRGDAADDVADDTGTIPAEDADASGGTDGMSEEADDDSDPVMISSVDELPQECIDVFGEFLREIEPLVESVDLESASMGELEPILDEFDARSNDFDADMEAAGCGNFEFTNDDEGLDAILEIADREAPGVVPFLEFLNELTSDFGDATGGADAPGDAALESCDDVRARFDELVGDAESIDDLPISAATELSTLSITATEVCTIDELESLFNEFERIFG